MSDQINNLTLSVLIFLVAGYSPQSIAQTTQSFDGVEISYDVKGTVQPALIFLHGWAGNRNHFQHMVDYFSSTHQTVSIDLAGFGESGSERDDWTMTNFAKDVTAVMDQEEVGQAVLVGHSMGGLVILEVAKQIPERIIGLIPLDIITNTTINSELTQIQIQEGVDYWMDWATKPTYEKTRRIFSNDTDSLIVTKVVNDLMEASKVGWKNSILESLNYLNELGNSLTEIGVPIHCINTSANKLDIEMARTHKPHISDSTIANVGHFFLWDAPEETNRLIQLAISKLMSK